MTQLCNAEVMKKVKLLEQDKMNLLAEESRQNQVTYQNEGDKFDFGYSFSLTREKVSHIDAEIRKLKSLLNYSNATTMVDGFDMTLGECLVYLAQLTNEKYLVENLAQQEAIVSRTTMGGKIEYTALNYDLAEAKQRVAWVNETIARLQIAIDRTNLMNMIEVK